MFSIELLVKRPVNITVLVPKVPTNCDSDNLILKLLIRVQGLATKKKILIKPQRMISLGSPKQTTTLLSSLKLS